LMASIAVFAEDGYEDLELWYPNLRLREAGHDVTVVAREDCGYESERGYPVEPDVTIDAVDASGFDGVVIPGGRRCPDVLRTDNRITSFVREIYEQGGLVAAICHAGWVLASAGILDGHTATCYHSIRDDVVNAGAEYVDEEVVVSDNLITSRHPGDLPAFLSAILSFLEDC